MDADSRTGLRERKKHQTRAALRGAAVRLYLRDGPERVTVHDICAEAGVSPRTFFNYFDSKDDALFDWAPGLTHHLATAVAEGPADEGPLATLHRATLEAVPGLVSDRDWQKRDQLLREHPELLLKLLHSGRRVEEAVARAVAARTGQPEDGLYPRLVAGAGMVVLRSALRGWDPDTGADGLSALLDEAFTSLAAGLPAPPG